MQFQISLAVRDDEAVCLLVNEIASSEHVVSLDVPLFCRRDYNNNYINNRNRSSKQASKISMSSSAASSKQKTKMIGGYTEEHLMKVAKDAVEKKTKNSVVLDRAAEDRIPRFLMSEVTIGQVLGRGGFCVVQEITKIQLSSDGAAIAASSSHHHDDTTHNDDTTGDNHHDDNDNDDDDDDQHYEHEFANLIQDRNFMAKQYRRRGKDYRYALKIVQESIKKDAQTYINGIVDLAIEARFLSVIRHSNIIKMRAMAMTSNSSGKSYFDPHFFVILDKLYDILSSRLVKWKRRLPTKMSRLLDRGGKKEMAFWLERLTVGYDLSCALKYLHDLHIVRSFFSLGVDHLFPP
jgi:hypothetical protein